ncbi:MAG: MoaD/ThiS family protein [Gammaproteobacteria bacterium]
MKTKVIFFASLRERLGSAEQTIELAEGATVAQAWEQVGGAAVEGKILAAVNEQYVGFDHVLGPDDELAFFPPVTGG